MQPFYEIHNIGKLACTINDIYCAGSSGCLPRTAAAAAGSKEATHKSSQTDQAGQGENYLGSRLSLAAEKRGKSCLDMACSL